MLANSKVPFVCIVMAVANPVPESPHPSAADAGRSPADSVILFCTNAESKVMTRKSPLRVITTFVHRVALDVVNLPFSAVEGKEEKI